MSSIITFSPPLNLQFSCKMAVLCTITMLSRTQYLETICIQNAVPVNSLELAYSVRCSVLVLQSGLPQAQISVAWGHTAFSPVTKSSSLQRACVCVCVCVCVCARARIYTRTYIYVHHHHHHVQEGLGLIPVPCILKMKLVPPSLPRSSYVSSSFWFIL